MILNTSKFILICSNLVFASPGLGTVYNVNPV